MSKTVYFETVRSGLVPVKVLGRRSDGQYEARVTRDHVPYRKGEVIFTAGRWLVYKSRLRDGFQYVIQADLGGVPQVQEAHDG